MPSDPLELGRVPATVGALGLCSMLSEGVAGLGCGFYELPTARVPDPSMVCLLFHQVSKVSLLQSANWESYNVASQVSGKPSPLSHSV